MTIVASYALGRLAFGACALLAPAATGRMLSGDAGATPAAQAFLRGMGAREIGIGLGLISAQRSGARINPWLAAGVLSDCGDLVGIAAAWGDIPQRERVGGAALAGIAALAGLVLVSQTKR